MSQTLLFLHAHPDDECILTGATIAAASHMGWRVVVAYATRGDAGETSKDIGGDTLGERRTKEAEAACAELGVARIEWLDFDDSGMVGTDTTRNPKAFCNAPIPTVVDRVSSVLHNEKVDVVVGYDQHGTYGHPDHVMVHRVARHVAAAVGSPWVFEATYNRDYLASLADHPYGDTISDNPDAFATPAVDLTHFVEGVDIFAAKAAAIEHHQSQVPDDWDEADPNPDRLNDFARIFGTEWYTTQALHTDAPWGQLGEVFRDKTTWSGAPPRMS